MCVLPPCSLLDRLLPSEVTPECVVLLSQGGGGLLINRGSLVMTNSKVMDNQAGNVSRLPPMHPPPLLDQTGLTTADY